MNSKLLAFFRRWAGRLQPHPDTSETIARLFHLAGWLVLVLLAVAMFWQAPSVYTGLALLWASVLLLCGVGLLWVAIALSGMLSPRMRWSIALLLTVLVVPFSFLGPVYFTLVAVLAGSIALLGVGRANALRRPGHWLGWSSRLLGGVGVVVLTAGVLSAGWHGAEKIAWKQMQAQSPLLMDAPAKTGKYAVENFTYGPGSDINRPLFGANVRFKTAPVDGSKLLQGWSGVAGWARSRYWQAEPKSLPLRGMVWMPDGEGPFPLALIVHGNHSMEDFSDDGYAYLGELFASQGIVTVSVDENFLNSSAVDLFNIIDGGLEEENDARGWILLEHLRQWRDWQNDPNHALFDKVDLERVALIGHSRGGEAVTEAAMFNSLPAYPDDATLEFDYGFGLRGVIAIAPVDDQYHPREQPTQFRDTNYLVIHGSHDGDVTAYAGFAAYNRLHFRDCNECFKAGFYLIGANHGQFNSGWGRYDWPAPVNWIFDTSTLMDADQQRGVAKSLFAAFLNAVLFDDVASREFVTAPHRAPQWLGENVRFLSHTQAAGDLVWADYEEDANVRTARQPGAEIRGAGLKLWRESEVELRWGDTDTAMVLLGWDHAQDEEAPLYELRFAAAQSVEVGQMLTFAVSMSREVPGDIEGYETPASIDFSIVLEDAFGNIGHIPLSVRRALLPQIKPTIHKHSGFSSDSPSEVVVQTYAFGFDEFLLANPSLDLAQIISVGFRFDLTPRGSIWLDNIALTK